MTLGERIRKIAEELDFDLRDPYTRILATAIAAHDQEDVRPFCGCCGESILPGQTAISSELGLAHWPKCSE